MKIIKSKIKKNAGMSYVELIVVLSIFSVISSVVVFNYSAFQANIEMKNLASDIALQIVQAQKYALSGVLPNGSYGADWKPAYGVYFNVTGLNQGADNKDFIYFTDLNNNNLFDSTDCTGECLNKITITKGNSVSRLDVYYSGDSTAHPLGDLTISFLRPNSGAVIKSSTTFTSAVSFVQITIVSPKGTTSLIKIFPSGRVQIN